MAHLTDIRESFSDVYDMESNALGFQTGPMGDCALIVVFWNQHGSLYRQGRGQHCSGGLPAAQFEKLFTDVGADATVFLVLGTVAHSPDGIDAEARKELEKRCREGNWTLKVMDGVPERSVLTHTGQFLAKSSYDQQLLDQIAENKNNGRCCVIM